MPRGSQVINGVEYVYEYVSYWDAEKQYGSHKRNYIGKMVDDVFVPNKKHQLQLALEAEQKKTGPVPVQECSRLQGGATYLLDAIDQKLKITEDLKACFPEKYRQIQSIAYYLILEHHNPLSRFPRWASTHHHPYGENISSQRSSELFGCIDEAGKKAFFHRFGKRRTETEYLVYDTTSISSYSKLIKQVKYGCNKDHDPLPQINLALLYGETSRLPVCYRMLPGNISDVTTIHKLLKDMDFLDIPKVKLVMDRGFYSKANLNELYRKHHKFLIAAKKSLNLVKHPLEEVRLQMQSRSHYSSQHEIYYHSRTVDWDYEETKPRSGKVVKSKKRMYLHLYYNPLRATDDRIRFNKLLDRLEEELLSDKRQKDHESLYHKYFEIQKTPVRGIKLTPRQEAIDEVEKNYGYFSLISNDIKDPLEALSIYRAKAVIEQAYDNVKDRLGMRRTAVSSGKNLDGKLFVQFIALIYLAYIDKAMREKNLYKTHTMQEVLDELDIIERYEHPGSRPHWGEVTKKQQELYALLGVAPPR